MEPKGQKPEIQEQPETSASQQDLTKALMKFGDDKRREFWRFRFAEEREWYESALFYQRRQWLRWNDQSRRWLVVKQDPQKPKPMPVSNYFAMTVNANANQLAGSRVRMTIVPNDESEGNLRAGQAAEKGLEAIDKESGFAILQPLLAKHTALWGMGITKDGFDSSLANGRTKVPVISTEATRMVSCADCGGTYDAGPPEPEGHRRAGPVEAQALLNPQGVGGQVEDLPCPQCGSQTTTNYEKLRPVAKEVAYFNRGKITTEVVPIFELGLPRDCQNPNLAKCMVQRYRQSLGKLRRLYGDKAKDIKADAPTELNEVYIEALRSLVNYNYLHEQSGEAATLTEVWADWDELPKDLQEKVEAAYADDPEKLESWQEYGCYEIFANDKMLEYGANFLQGKKPFTFFLWEVDPASTYPKGIAVDLVPLQKRLNRLDSLIELGMMTNAVGKWLWPSTQTTKKPSGSPVEVVEYDPIGDGKLKPEFVKPEPFTTQVWQLRGTILQDFQRLGNTMGVAQGQMPAGGGTKAFRALAYLGAKADEQLGTQRTLWEMAHQLRYEKCLILAQRFWDEPRKVKVAGYNGRYSMQQLMGKDLEGDYSLEFIPNSSRPRSLEEKEEALAALLQAGMVDPTDSATREYVIDQANLDKVNLTDHLQYMKAARDLEKVKKGEAPLESAFSKWDIFLKVFADFTMTEEFEALAPEIQQAITTYAEICKQRVLATMVPPADPALKANALGKALAARGKNNPLGGVPGETVPAGEAEKGAESEAANVASQLA